jgi:menaquinol-cytochrome c reductase iron-sulfur subunit
MWQAESQGWRCPCHKSSFARDGALVPATNGPPNPSPRALDPLEWRVSDGRLEVRWVRFETGIEERVEIGIRS